jgi:hypothetical protein
MTQYLMAVHGTDADHDMETGGGYGSPEAMREAMEETGRFNERLQADGYWVFAGGLKAASTATVVDGQGDSPVVTDGPYLESKEHIGGFWIIEAPDHDTALRLAAEASKACRGKVEVRPFEGA